MTTNFSLLQSGVSHLGGWNEDPFAHSLGAGVDRLIGLRFDMAPGRGQWRLDEPVTLTFNQNSLMTAPFQAIVTVWPKRFNFPPFSAAPDNPPTLGGLVLGVSPVYPDTTPTPFLVSVVLDIVRVNALAQHSNFNGNLALVVNSNPLVNDADLLAVRDFALTGEVFEAFTGLVGPWQAEGRADECPRCGGKSTTDTWEKDGVTKVGMCAKCVDPPDHYQLWRTRTREKPPVEP